MGIVKWMRKRCEKTRAAIRGRRFEVMGLSYSNGERLYPHVLGTTRGIAEDHLFRYEWAKPYCTGKVVLDYGCGVGYGSHVLSEVAGRVTGFDVSSEALKWADHYAQTRDNLAFTDTLPDSKFDCIACFECIEHVPNPDEVLDWLARNAQEYVFISTPRGEKGKPTWSKFHIHEFTHEEFLEKLSARFTIDDSILQPLSGGEVVLCRCRPRLLT